MSMPTHQRVWWYITADSFHGPNCTVGRVCRSSFYISNRTPIMGMVFFMFPSRCKRIVCWEVCYHACLAALTYPLAPNRERCQRCKEGQRLRVCDVDNYLLVLSTNILLTRCQCLLCTPRGIMRARG